MFSKPNHKLTDDLRANIESVLKEKSVYLTPKQVESAKLLKESFDGQEIPFEEKEDQIKRKFIDSCDSLDQTRSINSYKAFKAKALGK